MHANTYECFSGESWGAFSQLSSQGVPFVVDQLLRLKRRFRPGTLIAQPPTSGRTLLFVATGLLLPSQVWMRRHYESLSDNIAILAAHGNVPSVNHKSYPVVLLKNRPPPLLERLLHRMHLIELSSWSYAAWHQMLPLAREIEISSIFTEFLEISTRYSSVWQTVNKPVFIHCHGADVTWDARWELEPWRKRHYEGYEDDVRALPENVQFIANSMVTRQRLMDIGIGASRIHVKYLGVEVPETLADRRPATPCRLLYLGRLTDCKGPDLVIQAFDLACQRGLDGRLIMAGEGPARADCEKAIAQSNFAKRIELLGAVDRETGQRLRRESDIFVAHNRLGPATRQEEAFGVSIVEAMADGLPVITGRNGSTPEVLGDTGILIEPGDIEAQAEAMLRLASDALLYTRLRAAAHQRARKMFTLEREIAQLRAILDLR